MQKKESWKPIAGYEGLYEVSDRGKVKSLDRVVERKGTRPLNVKGRILKTSTNQYGHLKVNLWKKNKCEWVYVHRLVYETFVGEIPPKHDVHHIDGNPTNNIPSNMVIETHAKHIGSHSKGNKHRLGHAQSKETREKRRKAMLNRKDLSKPVQQFTLDGTLVATYPSATEASRQVGISQGMISRRCRQGMGKSKGYLWNYTKE